MKTQMVMVAETEEDIETEEHELVTFSFPATEFHSRTVVVDGFMHFIFGRPLSDQERTALERWYSDGEADESMDVFTFSGDQVRVNVRNVCLLDNEEMYRSIVSAIESGTGMSGFDSLGEYSDGGCFVAVFAA